MTQEVLQNLIDTENIDKNVLDNLANYKFNIHSSDLLVAYAIHNLSWYQTVQKLKLYDNCMRNSGNLSDDVFKELIKIPGMDYTNKPMSAYTSSTRNKATRGLSSHHFALFVEYMLEIEVNTSPTTMMFAISNTYEKLMNLPDDLKKRIAKIVDVTPDDFENTQENLNSYRSALKSFGVDNILIFISKDNLMNMLMYLSQNARTFRHLGESELITHDYLVKHINDFISKGNLDVSIKPYLYNTLSRYYKNKTITRDEALELLDIDLKIIKLTDFYTDKVLRISKEESVMKHFKANELKDFTDLTPEKFLLCSDGSLNVVSEKLGLDGPNSVVPYHVLVNVFRTKFFTQEEIAKHPNFFLPELFKDYGYSYVDRELFKELKKYHNKNKQYPKDKMQFKAMMTTPLLNEDAILYLMYVMKPSNADIIDVYKKFDSFKEFKDLIDYVFKN